MSDLIVDTAKKLDITPRALFFRAVKDHVRSNYLEAADYRFQRWFKFGEVPTYVSDWCLTQWRKESDAQPASHAAA